MVKFCLLFVMLLVAGSCALGQTCDPITGTCSIRESAVRIATAPARVVAQSAPVIANIAMAPVHVASDAYQEALASAQYRAANRIHGHSSLDTHRTSGVGWASSDPTPTTCLGLGGAAYAVVQGADGFYSTKFTENSSTTRVQSVKTQSKVRVRIFRR